MKIKKLLKRISQGLSILIVVAAISGFVYERIGRYKALEKAEKYRYGTLVDVGGHNLYYWKEGKGGPTVIFEAGARSNHTLWTATGIFQEINKHTATVVYDRAGMLYSERGNEPINADAISDDLSTMLEKEGFEKPYILVGYSAAGIYLRPFVEKHANDILGIVLIDPSHPDQLYNAPDEIKESFKAPFIPPEWIVDSANEFGLVRLLSQDWRLCYSVESGAAYEEFEYLVKETSTKSKNISFGAIPLVVISAGKFDNWAKEEQQQKAIRAYWHELQKEIVGTSSKGKHIIAEKSDHGMLGSERELIVNEILKMVQSNDSL